MQAHHPQGCGPLRGAQIRDLIASPRAGLAGGPAASAAAWRLRARDTWLDRCRTRRRPDRRRLQQPLPHPARRPGQTWRPGQTSRLACAEQARSRLPAPAPPDAPLEPHHQATIDRIRRETLVLVAQDTISLNYTGRPEMKGIGPISNAINGSQEIEMHSALACRPDGLPLGILDIECWHRNPQDFGKRKQCNAKPIQQEESCRWLRALRPIGDAAKACPATRIITLADREADIHEYMLQARDRRLAIVLRAKEKYRSLEGEGEPQYVAAAHEALARRDDRVAGTAPGNRLGSLP
jgi:hypothetical protein